LYSVHDLADVAQTLLSLGSAQPLHRLYFVQDNHQAGVPRQTRHAAHGLEVGQGNRAVHLPSDASVAPGHSPHGALTGQPADQGLGCSEVTLGLGAVVATHGQTEAGVQGSDMGQVGLQRLLGTFE